MEYYLVKTNYPLQRHVRYLSARGRNPQWWSRGSHNCSRVDVVTLNPGRVEARAATLPKDFDKRPQVFFRKTGSI
jgi:hypothetical protein